MAILNQKNALENGVQLKFGEVLSRLNFVGEDDMKALFILKEEAKKRFILDYNTVPKPEAAFADEKEKFETEISNLKEEKLLFYRKLFSNYSPPFYT